MDIERKAVSLYAERDCFICGHHFVEEVPVNRAAFVSPSNESRAMAVGLITTSEGVEIDFEVEVSCPNCKAINKFKKAVRR